MMMNKLRKNVKALSPIFATLILIAIAVIAGIVVYMFTSGTMSSMTGGGTAGQEKVAIQALSGNSATGVVTIYAQSTGGGPVSLDSAILKNSQGAVLQVNPTTDVINATLSTLTLSFPGQMSAGNTYTVTLVTTIGGSFVSQSFKAT
jgi:flagellin-like protein